MIAIKFNPKYEDRISLYMRDDRLFKRLGIKFDFIENPDQMCECAFWVIKYPHGKTVNVVLSALVEIKHVMGVEGLEFQYCDSLKELYQMSNEFTGYSNPWFKI